MQSVRPGRRGETSPRIEKPLTVRPRGRTGAAQRSCTLGGRPGEARELLSCLYAEEGSRCCSASCATPCCCRCSPPANGSPRPSGGHDLLGLVVLLGILNDQTALHDLVEQRLVTDLEEACRLRAIPVHPIEHFLDRHALGFAGRLAGDVLQADRRVGTGPHLERG